MRFVRKILRDEEGASVIMVAVAIVIVFGFAVVAIDMSLIQLAKTQLQNAADAGALAGATAMALTSGSQTDKEAAATAEAIRVCSLNVALQEIDRSVMITPDKVTFPQPTLVRVTTGTGDYVTTYFLRVLDPALPNQDEITATDGDGEYDPGEPFTDENGDSVWNPAELYDPEITGYKAPDHVGDPITLKLRNSNKSPRMCFYYAVRFGPVSCDTVYTGADIYQEWICPECEPFIVMIGDQLQMEPGMMVGPTNAGLECLIALDPGAQWDPGTETVINSAYATSPRIIKAPAFDPTLGVQNCHGVDCVTVTKIIVLFVEADAGSGEIVGRFMETLTEGVPGDCEGSFMYTVVLVE
jgi:hypothetical protein